MDLIVCHGDRETWMWTVEEECSIALCWQNPGSCSGLLAKVPWAYCNYCMRGRSPSEKRLRALQISQHFKLHLKAILEPVRFLVFHFSSYATTMTCYRSFLTSIYKAAHSRGHYAIGSRCLIQLIFPLDMEIINSKNALCTSWSSQFSFHRCLCGSCGLGCLSNAMTLPSNLIQLWCSYYPLVSTVWGVYWRVWCSILEL